MLVLAGQPAGSPLVNDCRGNLQTLQTLTTDMFMQLEAVKYGRAALKETQKL